MEQEILDSMHALVGIRKNLEPLLANEDLQGDLIKAIESLDKSVINLSQVLGLAVMNK